MPGQWTNFGKETVTVDVVGEALASVPAKAEAAYITCETADVRYWTDGTNPSTTDGHLLKAGDDLWFEGDAGQLRFTAVSGIPKLFVSYYVH